MAEDLRQTIITTCLKNGGHLGASLGAVELAVALHRCFDSPKDAIVWDVGHQAYAHKLLTGRGDRFGTLRTYGGLSGFLSREESPHDVFGAGHSSTSLSAALAMAWSRAQDAVTRTDWTIAVIGDGGLTAGVALEALNNIRSRDLAPFLLVVNDNQMSIAPNVGAIPKILGSGEGKAFFELFGCEYVGPIDGHDLPTLLGTLDGIKDAYSGKPIILHVLTQKGKGYTPAEEYPASFHGIGPMQSKIQGTQATPFSKTFSEAFGEALCELAERDPKIVAVTAAMPEGTGLSLFSQKFPDRFFDVGIAEQHAVTFAAGLATQGYRPVVAIYSTFLQRAFDGVIHDVALQGLPVVFAIDRAGLVGPDGPTHHGNFDLVYMGSVPGMKIFCPNDLLDLRKILEEAFLSKGPVAIRYPRGSAAEAPSAIRSLGKIRILREAKQPEVVAVCAGPAANRVLAAAQDADPEGTRVTVLSLLQVKPLPGELLDYLCNHPPKKALLTAEDGAVAGGFGQRLLAELSDVRSYRAVQLGYPDRFITHGSIRELETEAGVSVPSVSMLLTDLLGLP